MKRNPKLVSSPGYARFCFLLLLSLLFSAFTYAQTTVTGAVADAFNQHVSGATVAAKGTAKATTTDISGKFSSNERAMISGLGTGPALKKVFVFVFS